MLSHPVELTFTLPRSDKPYSIQGNFDEGEWRVLNDYLRYATRLKESKLFQSDSDMFLTIKWDANVQGMQVGAALPDWEYVESALHRLRPLYLESECTNFNKVRSLLGKRLQSDLVNSLSKQVRDIYQGKRLQSRFKITVNNEMLLNSDKALNTWLNAHEYHMDYDKQKRLEPVWKTLQPEGAKVIFLSMLKEKALAIFQLAAFVSIILGKEKQGKLSILPRYIKVED